MITLYSTGCPQCEVLKKKLDNKKIEYKICDNRKEIIDLGYLSVPLLKLEDGTILNFSEAIKWLKEN